MQIVEIASSCCDEFCERIIQADLHGDLLATMSDDRFTDDTLIGCYFEDEYIDSKGREFKKRITCSLCNVAVRTDSAAADIKRRPAFHALQKTDVPENTVIFQPIGRLFHERLSVV